MPGRRGSAGKAPSFTDTRSPLRGYLLREKPFWTVLAEGELYHPPSSGLSLFFFMALTVTCSFMYQIIYYLPTPQLECELCESGNVCLVPLPRIVPGTDSTIFCGMNE